MKYKTAAAFRQALEERLRQQSFRNNQTLPRLRKMVAFDRLLARLAKSDAGAWVVKGGFALQLRLGARARMTKDIDVALPQTWTREQVVTRIRAGTRLDLRDWFELEVGEPVGAVTGAPGGGFRLPVRCLLDGRLFETFHVDVGLGDPIVDAPEKITVPAVLGFAEIRPATVRCYPLTTQVAEKLHAYTRAYSGGATSRVRDLADILLAASITEFSGFKLRRAISNTFETRGTHLVPEKMPQPAAKLATPYRKLARELSLPWRTLKEAAQAAALFMNPILRGDAQLGWDPAGWKWRQGERTLK